MNQFIKENIALTALMVIFTLVPFFSGGHNSIFAFLLVVIFISFTIFFIKDSSDLPLLKNKFVITFCIFLAVCLLSVAVSPIFFVSFSTLLWWLVYFLVFISSITLFKGKPSRFELFSFVLITVAVVFGLIGVKTFLVDIDPYLRMQPIFHQHNAFGAFLLVPVFLSLGFFIKNYIEKKNKAAWFIISAFLVGVLLLTFSRGSVLSLILPLIVGAVFIFKIHGKKAGVRIAICILGIGIAGALFATAIFYLHTHFVKNTANNGPTIIYQTETGEANGFSLRAHYWKDALTLIWKKPVFGVGLGNYAQGMREYRSIDGIYIADPHNVYLKALAETGIGGLALIFFTLLLLALIWKTIRATQNPVIFMLALGLLALVIHGCIDIDWWFPANALVFFASAGALVADQKDSGGSKTLKYPLLIIAIIVFVCGSLIFMSLNHLEDAKFYASRDTKDLAREEFEKAAKINYFKNSDIPFFSGTMDGDEKKLDQAIAFSSHDATRYQARAQLLMKKKGNEKEIEQDLLSVIKYNRASSYLATEYLTELYLQQGKKEEAGKILKENLPWFERYRAGDVFKTDPNQEFIDTEIAKLKQYYILTQK